MRINQIINDVREQMKSIKYYFKMREVNHRGFTYDVYNLMGQCLNIEILDDDVCVEIFGVTDAEYRQELLLEFGKFKETVLYKFYRNQIAGLCDTPFDEYCLAMFVALTNRYMPLPETLTKFERFTNWLSTTDFEKAPASSKYHNATEGGLIEHILMVEYKARELATSGAFGSIDLASISFCALLHDLGKINKYETYLQNKKDDDTGRWYQQAAFKVVEHPLMNLGDGVSAIVIAMKFFKLTMMETSAIRWHNGRWLVSDGEIAELRHETDNNPLVLLLHTADMLAITNYVERNIF